MQLVPFMFILQLAGVLLWLPLMCRHSCSVSILLVTGFSRSVPSVGQCLHFPRGPAALCARCLGTGVPALPPTPPPPAPAAHRALGRPVCGSSVQKSRVPKAVSKRFPGQEYSKLRKVYRILFRNGFF